MLMLCRIEVKLLRACNRIVYRTTGQNKAQLCLSSNMGERHTIPYAKMVHSPNLRVVQRSTVLYVSVQRKGPKPCPENMRMPSNEFW